MKVLEIDRLHALPDVRHLLFQGRSYDPAHPPRSDWRTIPRAVRERWKTTRVYVFDLISGKVGVVPVPYNQGVSWKGPVRDVSSAGPRIAVSLLRDAAFHEQLGIYDLVTGHLTRLPVQPCTRYETVRFSPNGDRLAFERWDEAVLDEQSRRGRRFDALAASSVWVANLQTGKMSQIAIRYGLCGWTSDGERLLLSQGGHNGEPGLGDLFTVDVAGPNHKRALTRSGDVLRAGVSHARGLIVYLRYRRGLWSRAPQLWVMHEDGSDRRLLVSLSHPGGFHGSISPDGRRLAYVSSGVIRVVDIDTGRQTRVTPHEGTYRSPVWVADGSAVAFVEGYDDYEHGERILLGEPTGKNRLQLLVGKARASK